MLASNQSNAAFAKLCKLQPEQPQDGGNDVP